MNYHITDSNDKVVYTNINPDCIKCIKSCQSKNEIIDNCYIDNKKHRRGVVKKANGSIYCCSSSKDFVKSSRIFKEKISLLSNMIDEFAAVRSELIDETSKDTKRLLHNLISINAHSIQEVYNLIPQQLLTSNISEQYKVIQDHIIEDPKEAARVFLRIAKNNAAMKSEFAVFKKLHESSPTTSFKKHPIKKVILNVLHIFFQDFADINVTINVERFDGLVRIDYESFFVALYHLFDNAVKYILPRSQLKIKFKVEENKLTIQFDMMSIRIEEHETEKVYLEGYSGVNTKMLHKAGQGIGMHLMKKLLELNNSSLRVAKLSYGKRMVDKIPYENNVVEIIFST